jgi:ATP-binding cassette subfamily C (CFTR/MRP) protein 1
MYSATFLAWLAGLKASAILHNSLLSNILKCPMDFFDATPTGRLLARFSHDVNTLDDRLINNFRSVVLTSLRVR